MMGAFSGLELCAVLEGHAGEFSVAYYDAAGGEVDAKAFRDALGGVAFSDVTYDSRSVGPAALFVCKGASFSERYLADAVSRGASAYLAQQPHASTVPGVVVSDVRRAMAYLADAFFGHPSGELSLVGVTGTKGKTTVSFYVDAILRAARPDVPHALLTGVVVDDGTCRSVAHNTTPEAIELQRHLRKAVDAGCPDAVMEASSQGFKYDRTLCTRFGIGVFTNIGEDHISPVEHPTFEDYFASKLRIFGQSDCAVVNLDSAHVARVLDAARADAGRLLTYSLDDERAEVRLLACEHRSPGLWGLRVSTPTGRLDVELDSLGRFNVSNALAAVAACEALGVAHEAMARGLAAVRVPGRMERYDSPDGQVVGIVDYAHNEMSMEALLSCVREEFPDREVTVVFGATGTRGTHRRPGLGRAAGRLADRIILTEDDPGPVPVEEICEEIGASVREQGGTYETVVDRPSAVHRAVCGARRPAVVVLAGKGAEASILRAEGSVRCDPDAKLFCDEVGVEFRGYDELIDS